EILLAIAAAAKQPCRADRHGCQPDEKQQSISQMMSPPFPRASLEHRVKQVAGVVVCEIGMKIRQSRHDRVLVIPSDDLEMIKAAVKSVAGSDGAIGEPDRDKAQDNGELPADARVT